MKHLFPISANSFLKYIIGPEHLTLQVKFIEDYEYVFTFLFIDTKQSKIPNRNVISMEYYNIKEITFFL